MPRGRSGDLCRGSAGTRGGCRPRSGSHGAVGRDREPHVTEEKAGSGGAVIGRGRHLDIVLGPSPSACLLPGTDLGSSPAPRKSRVWRLLCSAFPAPSHASQPSRRQAPCGRPPPAQRPAHAPHSSHCGAARTRLRSCSPSALRPPPLSASSEPSASPAGPTGPDFLPSPTPRVQLPGGRIKAPA